MSIVDQEVLDFQWRTGKDVNSPKPKLSGEPCADVIVDSGTRYFLHKLPREDCWIQRAALSGMAGAKQLWQSGRACRYVRGRIYEVG